MAFDFNEWGLTSYLRFRIWRSGELVGTDQAGNKYYVDRRTKGTKREKRWVVYNGASEASRVPPEWHGWLHHQTDTVPSKDSPWRKPWVKEHTPNLTGTVAAYKPPGALERGGRRSRATGDYQAWSPDGAEPPPATPGRTETREDGRLRDEGDVLGHVAAAPSAGH